MARSHLRYVIRDSAGNVIQNAAANVFQPGTTTAVTGMFNAKTGGSALSNPLISNAQGEVEAWLTTAQSVDLQVTDNNDTAFIPGQAGTISFATITEALEVMPAPEDIGGATNLDGLSDVTITAAASGEYIRHNGTAWVDAVIEDADIPSTIARDAEVTSAIASHAAAADPHTGYQLESEKGAVNGYASLDANSRVPNAQIATGTPDGTKFLRDDRTWAAASGGGTTHTLVRKTADETVNNSAILQNDDHLFMAVAANEVWAFECVVLFSSATTTPDLRVAFTVPTGATLAWAPAPHSTAADAFTTSIVTTASGSSLVVGAGASARLLLIKGIVRNGATAGNLQFQWSQNSATAEDTKVLLDSYLLAHRF